MLKKILPFLFIFLLINCTSTKSIPEKFDNSNNNGIFYGLLIFPKEKSYMETFTIFYKKKDAKIEKKYKQTISISNKQNNLFDRSVNFKPDYYNEKENIYLFAIETPPGEYEFYQIETTVINVDTWTTSTSEIFSIDFKVNKGIISYLGNYKFYEKGNEKGAYLEISDNKELADDYFKHYQKNLNWKNSINKTPKFSNNRIIEVK
jgi:hypothetical protein